MTRTPRRTDGSLALQLDFERPAATRVLGPVRALRLARHADKYRNIEHRRRQAQIAARRLLDLVEEK